MRLSKQISRKAEDKHGRTVDQIVELSIKDHRMKFKDIELYDLLKVLCIAVNCDSDCSNCVLKNEVVFKEKMKYE